MSETSWASYRFGQDGLQAELGTVTSKSHACTSGAHRGLGDWKLDSVNVGDVKGQQPVGSAGGEGDSRGCTFRHFSGTSCWPLPELSTRIHKGKDHGQVSNTYTINFSSFLWPDRVDKQLRLSGFTKAVGAISEREEAAEVWLVPGVKATAVGHGPLKCRRRRRETSRM